MYDSDEFIENFIIEENIAKFILIGDKQVGKTLLKNRIVDDISASNSQISLISKKNKVASKKNQSKFEIWDTNTELINSPFFQSKFY